MGQPKCRELSSLNLALPELGSITAEERAGGDTAATGMGASGGGFLGLVRLIGSSFFGGPASVALGLALPGT